MHGDPTQDAGDLTALRGRFEQWREQRLRRGPIPRELLTAAVGLMGRYPRRMLAKTLRLNYGHLKVETADTVGRSGGTVRRISRSVAPGARSSATGQQGLGNGVQKVRGPMFIKIPLARSGAGQGWGLGPGVIEFENPRGFKARVAGVDGLGLTRELMSRFCGERG